MDGNKEFIKMSKLEEKITEIWDELILKERLKTIIINMDKMEASQNNNRNIIKEELTNLWNTSEIPTFKQILEKLTLIQTCLEKKHLKEDNEILNIEKIDNKELTAVTAIGRIKEPIRIDISKSKPKLTNEVKVIIGNLAELHKQGKF